MDLKDSALSEVAMETSSKIKAADEALVQLKSSETLVKELESRLVEVTLGRDTLLKKIADLEIKQVSSALNSFDGSFAGFVPGKGMPELDYLRLKVNQLEKRVKCDLCKTNRKEVLLPCNHMFCEPCIQKNIESRQRQCPLDR